MKEQQWLEEVLPYQWLWIKMRRVSRGAGQELQAAAQLRIYGVHQGRRAGYPGTE